MVNRLRLGSGLVLFAWVLCHFTNHALGLFSIGAMNAAQDFLLDPWQSVPGTILLVGAALTHLGVALRSVYVRRHLRLQRWEAWQLGLGLCIPLLLMLHVADTRLAEDFLQVNQDYTSVLTLFWRVAPVLAYMQVALLLLVWAHACVGLHYWLRLRGWYRAAVPVLFPAAVILPTLALAGFVAAGSGVRSATAEDPELAGFILLDANLSPENRAAIQTLADNGRLAFVALVLAVFGGRLLRNSVSRRLGAPQLVYRSALARGGSPLRRVDILPGATALETLRAAGIPHASVCGGRARCSTCRVRVGAGGDALPAAAPTEAALLKRIGAPPSVRLACQIRPSADVELVPLLPPDATPADSRGRSSYRQGAEREIVVLFADLRGFTSFSEGRLPFDVVFVLNQYFSSMGQAIEGAGGVLDKFIGDGIMALFGVESGPRQGALEAIDAARAMSQRLAELNAALAGDLPAPLRVGIGLHLGPAIVGEMGWGRAISLTAIGDTVNVASRLESMTKEFAAEVVLSEAVAAAAGVDLDGFARHEVEVRGRRDRLPVYVAIHGGDLPA